MVVTLSAWLAALQSLLPPGRAFTREPGSVMTQVLSAIAAMFLAAQLWLEDLLYQADPRNATTMLPRWEAFLGLPDKCTPAGQSLAARQRAAYQRLLEEGGQSRAYFISLAALLGEPGVTITEFESFTCNSACDALLSGPNDIFAWRANIPHAPENLHAFDCNSNCNDGMQIYTPCPIECAFNERKPAHTNVFFSYTG